MFALRKDVKFHNGKEMTPADVVASLERYRKVGASATLLGAIDSIAASGPNEVTVKLKSVQSTFLGQPVEPARADRDHAGREKRQSEAARRAPSAPGPFKFVEYKPDSHVKIEKFADYKPNPAYKERDGFAGSEGRLSSTRVTFRFMPEAGARNAALESGAGASQRNDRRPDRETPEGNAKRFR